MRPARKLFENCGYASTLTSELFVTGSSCRRIRFVGRLRLQKEFA
jgi:hypothetical protein